MDGIKRSDHIHGDATPILQGEIRRNKPTVHSEIKIPLPLTILERHKRLHLKMYFKNINGLIFLQSKKVKINLFWVKSVISRGATSFIKALD